MGFSSTNSLCNRQLYVKSLLREIHRKIYFHKRHTSAFVLCGVEGGALKLSNRQVLCLIAKFWGIVLSAASLHFSQWSAMRRHKPLQSTAMLVELTFAPLLRLKVYGFIQVDAK